MGQRSQDKEEGREVRGVKYQSGKWYRFKLTEELDSDFPEGIDFAGTYIIFSNGKCLYIGQSKDLKTRLKTHIKLSLFSSLWQTPWGYIQQVEIAIRKERYRYERLAIEAKFIDRLKPMFNGLPPGANFKLHPIYFLDSLYGKGQMK